MYSFTESVIDSFVSLSAIFFQLMLANVTKSTNQMATKNKRLKWRSTFWANKECLICIRWLSKSFVASIHCLYLTPSDRYVGMPYFSSLTPKGVKRFYWNLDVCGDSFLWSMILAPDSVYLNQYSSAYFLMSYVLQEQQTDEALPHTCSASAMGEEIGSLQSKADCKEENT